MFKVVKRRNFKLLTHLSRSENIMLSWAIGFFIIAIIAAVLGFGGIAGSASGIAQILFVLFLIFAIVSFFKGRSST